MAIDNRVFLIGHLTRDPELKYTPKGTAVVSLDLAVNRQYRDTNTNELVEKTVFVNDITFWGNAAETLHKWVTKGMPLAVEGRLDLDTWADRETGKNRNRLRVVGEEFKFLGKKGDAQPRDAAASPPPAATQPQATPNIDDEEEDDIPF